MRRWEVRWLYRDGDESTRAGSRTFDSYQAASIHVGRVIEAPRDLEWVTGPTEQSA